LYEHRLYHNDYNVCTNGHGNAHAHTCNIHIHFTSKNLAQHTSQKCKCLCMYSSRFLLLPGCGPSWPVVAAGPPFTLQLVRVRFSCFLLDQGALRSIHYAKALRAELSKLYCIRGQQASITQARQPKPHQQLLIINICCPTLKYIVLPRAYLAP
jgi:hypothetical protein